MSVTDGDYAGWLSRNAEAAWATLGENLGQPRRVDIAVLVKLAERPRSREGRVVLDVTTEKGGALGRAFAFSREWYPGRPAGTTPQFSHYGATLWRVLSAMERRGDTNPLRLQVLQAVRLVNRAGEPLTVMLKFIIAPEYTLTGSQLESIYGCPLQAFYTGFVGIPWNPRRLLNTMGSVRGDAVHGGYRRAAASYVEQSDLSLARTAYFDGVREVWAAKLASLLRDKSKKPGKDIRVPIEAVDPILAHCQDTWPQPLQTRLFHERLFYAPSRGISGRADRIEQRRDQPDGLTYLTEVKTGGSFGDELDPATGTYHAGGVQSLAYREILHALGTSEVDTNVEKVGDGTVTRQPLATHPLATRLGLSLEPEDERALDLIAQARNTGFCAISGLYTGYDRHLLDAAGRGNRFLSDLRGDFELYKQRRPCQLCPARSREICSQADRNAGAAHQNLFTYAPNRLFAYWAWFHRQLKSEERRQREHLHHLVSVPVGALEDQEGSTIDGLRLTGREGYEFTFSREESILTRIRDDDRVLVTPANRLPGQVLSIEGSVVEMTEHRVTVRLRDRLDSTGGTFRIDEMSGFDMPRWQVEGLTDFLINAMTGTAARGRKIELGELPSLARVILGHRQPNALNLEPIRVIDSLNSPQQDALNAALQLQPGNLMLIQGPPGTGKTALIARLARELLTKRLLGYDERDAQRPLLILANTNRAANEVVHKIVASYPELAPFVLRVGAANSSMEPEVAAQVLSEKVDAGRVLAETDMEHHGPDALSGLMRQAYVHHRHAGIFIGTLAGADRPELRGLTFEVVIVDEAGQATEPGVLQSLRHLETGLDGKLVLVGDHKQLPPVVAQDEPLPEFLESFGRLGLREGDSLRTSAFERLARLYPEAVLTLTEQYRMNDPISRLVSHVFYDGALRPANARIAEQRLDGWFSANGILPPEGLLTRTAPILFIDTSRDPAGRDSGARLRLGAIGDDARENPREAALIAQLIAELMRGIPESRWDEVMRQVGVIAPYRRQNNLIRQELLALDSRLKAIRVDTVDRFQGGEREIVIVSLVNSNAAHSIGSLHADWRRMNVAISRARRKLVILGDRETFIRDEGRPEEADAKARYRRLFAQLDELVAEGAAEVVDSAALIPHPVRSLLPILGEGEHIQPNPNVSPLSQTLGEAPYGVRG